MSSRLMLVTFVATLFSANFAIAQNPAENFESFVSNSETAQLNFPDDSSDIGTVQRRYSESVSLFKTKTQASSLVSGNLNAQREIVSNTLTLIGAALLVCVIVIGTFVYSTRRGRFGEPRPPSSDW